MFQKIKFMVLETVSKSYNCITQVAQYNYHGLYGKARKMAKGYSKELRSKAADLPQTNFDLAIYHFNLGNISDAIMRFKMVRLMTKKQPRSGIPGFGQKTQQPQSIEDDSKLIAATQTKVEAKLRSSSISDATIDYYLGRCYFEKYNYVKASEYITKYFKSDDKQFINEAKFCDLILKNKQDEITALPGSLLQRKRNRYAAEFKANLLNQTGAKHAFYLNSLSEGATAEYNSLTFILPYLKDKLETHDMLDILSGTGNFAYLCRKEKMSHMVVGVEPSDVMTTMSKKLKYDTLNVYSEVMQFSNLLNFFSKAEAAHNFKYGIIVAHEIFSFYCDIKAILNYISAIIVKNGVLLLYFKSIDKKEPKSQKNMRSIIFNSNKEEFCYDSSFINDQIIKAKWFIIYQQNIYFELDNTNGVVLALSKAELKMPKVDLSHFFNDDDRP